MRLYSLVVAAILTGAPVFAQEPEPSPADAPPSSSVDGGESKLPVSLDRIREALAKAPAKPLLRGVAEQPDFKITVEERVITLDDLFKPEDFRVGPTPAGGLYAYEQQQVLSNKVDSPLTQPYAAFSGNELITLALESLVIKYLASRAVGAVTEADRAAREAAARAAVARAIAEYCAAQPDSGTSIPICSTAPPSP
jgi:hypothetical protein